MHTCIHAYVAFLRIRPSIRYLSVCFSVCLLIFLCVYLPVIFTFVYLSIYLSIYTCLSVYLSIYFAFYLSIYLHFKTRALIDMHKGIRTAFWYKAPVLGHAAPPGGCRAYSAPGLSAQCFGMGCECSWVRYIAQTIIEPKRVLRFHRSILYYLIRVNLACNFPCSRALPSWHHRSSARQAAMG